MELKMIEISPFSITTLATMALKHSTCSAFKKIRTEAVFLVVCNPCMNEL
jgi:hypothetical protein